MNPESEFFQEPDKNRISQSRCCFITMFQTHIGERHARIAIEGLRTFGGRWKNSTVCAFLIRPSDLVRPLQGIEGVEIYELDIPDEIQGYIFSEKVAAASKAEQILSSRFDSLVWFDSRCLFVNAPALFDLGMSADAGLRPVHIRNIGSPVNSRLDPYWQEIYSTLDANDTGFTVTSYCDGESLRPYFNLHCYAINPKLGLCQEWYGYFSILVRNRSFQENACQDELHQIFLHQAIFSTLISRQLKPDRIRLLPPAYNYPLHLHPDIPQNRQATNLNNLVNVVYEDRYEFPKILRGLEVAEPLNSWLSNYDV